ncbi:MAG TPA: DsbA family oxidoreductase [Myxococcota bacterium]
MLIRLGFAVVALFALAACQPKPDPSTSTSTSTATTTTAAAETAPAKQVVVDVYSDIVCPWCFIGTERLDAAIAASGVGDQVVLKHHPFLLLGDVPDEGIDVADMLRKKTGRDPQEMFARVEGVAKSSGIELSLGDQPRNYSTISSHILLKHAAAKGTQRALEKDLFRAHFQQKKNIADVAVLTDIATRHGFSADEVARLVADTKERDEVRSLSTLASQAGVRGVPFFTFNGENPMSGAQDEAVFVSAIQRAVAR